MSANHQHKKAQSISPMQDSVTQKQPGKNELQVKGNKINQI